MIRISLLTIALVGCSLGDCRVDVQQSQAQAVGPIGLTRVHVLDGGLCTGTGTSGDPIDCAIHVDTDGGLSGTGSAGAPLTAANGIASIDFALFGDGSDGALTFDGSSVVLGITPSSGTYTLPRDIFCDGCTIDSGASVTGPFRVFDKGTLTLDGTIHRNGNAGSGATPGAALAAGSLPAGSAGGAGGSSAGGVGGTGGAANPAPRGCTSGQAGAGASGSTCQGAGGGSGAAGVGGLGGNITIAGAGSGDIRYLYQATFGRQASFSVYAFASGGGGGRGDAASVRTGGGGGGSGGYVFVSAKKIVGGGTIESKGGDGAPGATGGNTGGGGGGGGARVFVVIGTGSCPTMIVTGGAGGAGQGTGATGGTGGSGATHCQKAGL